VIYDGLIAVMIYPDQERCAEDTCKRTAPSMMGWHDVVLIGCYVVMLVDCYVLVNDNNDAVVGGGV
jgi:hypothetical protein